jgi:predicted permease
LTAEKITDLAIIPVIFIVQTAVSYFCAFVVTRCCRFKKRQSNFVTAMAVCDDRPIWLAPLLIV